MSMAMTARSTKSSDSSSLGTRNTSFNGMMRCEVSEGKIQIGPRLSGFKEWPAVSIKGSPSYPTRKTVPEVEYGNSAMPVSKTSGCTDRASLAITSGGTVMGLMTPNACISGRQKWRGFCVSKRRDAFGCPLNALVGRSRYAEKYLVTRFNIKCNLTPSHRGSIQSRSMRLQHHDIII